MYVGKFIDGVVGSTVHDELQPPTSDTSVRAFMCSGAVLRGVRGRVGDRVIVLKLHERVDILCTLFSRGRFSSMLCLSRPLPCPSIVGQRRALPLFMESETRVS